MELLLVLQLPLKETTSPGGAQATHDSYVKAARGLEAPFVLTGGPTAEKSTETMSMIARFLRGSLGFIPRQYLRQGYLSFSENVLAGSSYLEQDEGSSSRKGSGE